MATMTRAETARAKFLENMRKSYGASVVSLASEVVRPQAISTGALSLDAAMASGGFMRKRITEVWGPPGGGKTTLTLIAAAGAQKTIADKYVAFIDVEGTFDKQWAEELGVDTDRMDVYSPPNAEEVADLVKDLLQSEQYSMIILDSIGAMLPKEEFEKDAAEVSVGTIAKIITRMVKMAAVYAKRYDVALVIINQVRANIGFGKDTDTGGGWGLKHVTSHKLHVKRGSAAYVVGSGDNKVNVGYKMSVKVEKSKVSPEGRVALFDIYLMPATIKGVAHSIGINLAQDAAAVGIRLGVIQQRGAQYTMPDGSVLKTREIVEDTLTADPILLEKVRAGVLEAIKDDFKDDETYIPSEDEVEETAESKQVNLTRGSS
jgi:recombination protein RecA